MEKIIKIVDVSTLCLYNERHRSYEPQWLNRNIGCIEISISLGDKTISNVLNRNIGCIEIPPENIYLIFLFKLNRNIGCIEIAIQYINRDEWLG